MKSLLFALLCITPFFTAIDITGDWSSALQDREGNSIPVTLSFTADTYAADFGNDGTVDVAGSYTLEGNQISMTDREDIEEPCPGTGVYTILLEGNEMRLELVSDDCEVRKGALSTMVMTRQ